MNRSIPSILTLFIIAGLSSLFVFYSMINEEIQSNPSLSSISNIHIQSASIDSSHLSQPGLDISEVFADQDDVLNAVNGEKIPQQHLGQYRGDKIENDIHQGIHVIGREQQEETVVDYSSLSTGTPYFAFLERADKFFAILGSSLEQLSLASTPALATRASMANILSFSGPAWKRIKKQPKYLSKASLIFVSSKPDYDYARKANPSAILSQIGMHGICLLGSRSTQYKCIQSFIKSHLCADSSPDIIDNIVYSFLPEQYPMDEPNDCHEFFKSLVKRENRDNSSRWIIRPSLYTIAASRRVNELKYPIPRSLQVNENINNEDTLSPNVNKTNSAASAKAFLKSPEYSIVDLLLLADRYHPCSTRKKKYNEIMVKKVPNQAHIAGHAFSVRTYLLIANADPFVAYIHKGYIRRSVDKSEMKIIETKLKESRMKRKSQRDTTQRLKKGESFPSNNQTDSDGDGDDDDNNENSSLHIVFDYSLAEKLLENHKDEQQVLSHDYFTSTFVDTVRIRTSILAQTMLKELIEMKARNPSNSLKRSFQIFSLDWLVTADGKIYFIDSNGLPPIQIYQNIPETHNMWQDCMSIVVHTQQQFERNSESLTGKKIIPGKGEWSLLLTKELHPLTKNNLDQSLCTLLYPLLTAPPEKDKDPIASMPKCDTKKGEVAFGSLATCSRLEWYDIAKLAGNRNIDTSLTASAYSTPHNFFGDICGASKLKPLLSMELEKNEDSIKSQIETAPVIALFASIPGAKETRCSGYLSWTEANKFCEIAGARLCTFQELHQRQATAFTGCSADLMRVWSGTQCGPDSYITTGGKRTRSVKPRCVQSELCSTFIYLSLLCII